MAIRTIEVFTAGCSLCSDVVQRVQSLACSSCHVDILDMKDESTQEKAKRYGVVHVPAVVVNGTLAECCQGSVIDETELRKLGVGVPA